MKEINAMNQKINYINELTKKHKSLLPMSVENKRRLDKKFMLEFNYNSNHLEGNTLTYNETELVLIFGDTKGDHTLREYEEMQAHNIGYNLVKELASEKERPLTESFIKNLNEVILVRSYWKDAETVDGQPTRREIKVGDYKEFPNSVRLSNGEIFHYESVADTPILMKEIIDWYRAEENKKELSSVELAALLHYKFVRIHPFDDGNGRISRLLLNYVLLKNDLPPVIIKSADKNRYLSALHQADAGDEYVFVSYIADQLIWSLELCIKAARGESIDEPGDLDKKLNWLKNKLDIHEDILKETKSLNAIQNVLEKSIIPLCKYFLINIKKFDVLFKDNHSELHIDSVYIDKLERIFEYQKLTNIKNESNLILLKYIFKEFRKPGVRPFNAEIHFQFIFRQNAYEIHLFASPKVYSKLYHQYLTEGEIQEMFEILGNQIYDQIEKKLNL